MVLHRQEMLMRYFSCCVCKGHKIRKRSLRKSSHDRKRRMSRRPSFGNLSTRSDRSKIRYISDEIGKFGKGNGAQVFTYNELSVATQNFSQDNLIGEGGFGRVYKGYLQSHNNKEVAVKELDRNGFQGNQEFMVEVVVLSLLRNPNLVHFMGYCAQGSHRVLVYEYLKNGSLEDHLFITPSSGKEPLDWNTRMKIARGAAKGLQYLHEGADPPVIYRDFKASNILLDKNFNPKLSDFGLAKVGHVSDNYVSAEVMGTYGYCAPEYANSGHLTTKSDVYSFGVVFLELIAGRRVIDYDRAEEEHNLLAWAEPLFRDKKKFHRMVDPSLEGKYPEKGLYQALAVAAMCLSEDESIRPLIGDVVSALSYLCADQDDDDHETEDEDEEEDDDQGQE